MSAAVVGIAVRCAAGDLAALRALLSTGGDAFASAPPYPSAGLANAACGLVAEVSRRAPAEDLLEEVVRAALAQAAPPPDARIALVVGTSSGNVSGPWERWHRATLDGRAADEEGTGRDAPTLRVAAALGLSGPTATLCAACVSGTAALAVAEGWLRHDVADFVVAAGVDALSLYVHAGFSGLGALTATRPRPFHADRDGLLLGEGAAALVLAPGDTTTRALAWLRGAGMASDATHITAPARDGHGAIAALRQALRAAEVLPHAVDAVSVHGTGTPFNDAMEATALFALFGARPLAVHGVKHAIGHTLGAAGAIEAAVLVDAIARGELPPDLTPPPGDPTDPAPRIAVHAAGAPAIADVAVSMSSAFGGLNAAIVLASKPAPPSVPAPRPVRQGPSVEVDIATPADWATAWDDPPPRVGRLDPYTRVGLLALDRLRRLHPIPSDAALILVSRHGCRAIDLTYHARIVTEGAGSASRLAFTYTLPGSPLAEASIRFGWRGPQVPFVGDPALADAEALRWVCLHGASAAVALVCDAPEPDGPAHARATLWLPLDAA